MAMAMPLALPDLLHRPASSPLRIALFTDSYAPQVNGVVRTLNRLVTVLTERGHAVRVFAPNAPGVAGEEPAVSRWPSIPFWAYPQLRLAAPGARSVERSVADWKPTVIHVATPFGLGLAGVAAAETLGIPVISSYHTSLTDYARYYGLGALSDAGWTYLRWFHNRTLRTYAPTSMLRNDLQRRGFRRVRVWPRGVDSATFNPGWRSDELRRSWKALPGMTVVSYVGRLAKEIGIDVALEAMSMITEMRRDVVCVVVGDGPYEAEARARAPRGTIFTGSLGGRALSEAYASSDILLTPSITDTFGNVLLEGMASGLAVIASDVPQTRAVVGEGAVALCPPGDTAAFARQIASTIADPGRRDAVQRRAVALARLRGWGTVFDDLIADYEDVACMQMAFYNP